ncbi:unnamed protein product [Somion occarium]|uniref:Uncharacterized protein n=1 Tax=Somion occarium TaxID=3059160 RepID=A0ABP1DQZ7_9APHY
MFRVPTIVSLLLLALPTTVFSSPCVTFDATFNLLVFGLNGKDWNAGTQDTWSSGSAADITTSGRPPFDGENTTCYLAQFFNTVYVMNGDAANPSSVHIYDAGTKSWSTQSVTTGSFDPSSFNTILDHDTNVFYALSHGELFFLDMGGLKAANSSALSWTDVSKSPYGDSYQPVMALAQNHIHFLNVPDTPAGDAQIFVIHCEFLSYKLLWCYSDSYVKSRSSSPSLKRTRFQMAVLSLLHMVKPRRSSKKMACNKNLHSFLMMVPRHTSSTSRPTQHNPFQARLPKIPKLSTPPASLPWSRSTALALLASYLTSRMTPAPTLRQHGPKLPTLLPSLLPVLHHLRAEALALRRAELAQLARLVQAVPVPKALQAISQLMMQCR